MALLREWEILQQFGARQALRLLARPSCEMTGRTHAIPVVPLRFLSAVVLVDDAPIPSGESALEAQEFHPLPAAADRKIDESARRQARRNQGIAVGQRFSGDQIGNARSDLLPADELAESLEFGEGDR